MKVLQFAFDPWNESDYLPHRHVPNCVIYTGTHDNNTIRGWVDAGGDEVEHASRYLHTKDRGELVEQLMLTAFASVANTCILTMQDILHLGAHARMNAPSTMGNNWQWRAQEFEINSATEEFLRYNTKLYRRANPH
jgi:4-alpha-glucanotransferase